MSKEKFSSYSRAFSGKHGFYSNVEVLQPKTQGSEIGVLISCSKTNSEKRDEKINFLGKFTRNPVGEKIYMDIVKYFSNGPSTRLIWLPEEDFKKYMYMSPNISSHCTAEEYEDLWNAGLQDSSPKVNGQYLVYLSKLIQGFHNLDDFQVNDLNEIISFNDYIEKYHRFPSTVILNDQEYLLTGIMKIAAVALLIGDPDWLGGSCRNTGAYIKTINNTDYAVAINVDAGFAAKDVEPFKISKNVIPYGSCFSPKDELQHSIHIDKLLPEHLSEFLKSVNSIVNRYSDVEDKTMDALLKALVMRNGIFNDAASNEEILTESEALKIVHRIKYRIQEMKLIYSERLEAYAKNNAECLHELIRKEQEKDRVFLRHFLGEEEVPNEHKTKQDSHTDKLIIQPDENSLELESDPLSCVRSF